MYYVWRLIPGKEKEQEIVFYVSCLFNIVVGINKNIQPIFDCDCLSLTYSHTAFKTILHTLKIL